MFEIASHSVNKPDKRRNGDHVITRETSDGAVLLVLADGVGGRPCDWKASEVTCRATAETFGEASGAPAERLEAGVREAHRRVGRETGRCEGMLAALVALAWEPEADEAVYVGVGDARIYRLLPGEVEQVTEDDVTTERVEPDFPGAKPFLRSMITQAVGGSYERGIVEIKTMAFPNHAGLVLASDGAYPLSGFGREARRILEAGPMQQALEAWLGADGLSNDDDATAAVLRRSRIAPGDRPVYEEVLSSGGDFREQGHAAHLMLEVAFDEVETGLAEAESDAVRRGLDTLADGELVPGREKLIAVVDQIGESDLTDRRDLFERALELVRKQPF